MNIGKKASKGKKVSAGASTGKPVGVDKTQSKGNRFDSLKGK